MFHIKTPDKCKKLSIYISSHRSDFNLSCKWLGPPYNLKPPNQVLFFCTLLIFSTLTNWKPVNRPVHQLTTIYVILKWTRRAPFRNTGFVLNEKFQQNASKFAVFYIGIRKPKVAFSVFHFMPLYIFPWWMPWSMSAIGIDQGIH